MGPEPPFGQLQAPKVAANRPLPLETARAGHAQNDGRFCHGPNNPGSLLSIWLNGWQKADIQQIWANFRYIPFFLQIYPF